MTARKPGGWHYVAKAAEQLGDRDWETT